jgi:hypothetical protein
MNARWNSTGLLCAAGLALVMAAGAESRAQIPEGFEMVRLTGSALHSRPDINNRSEIMWSESYPPLVSDIYLFSRGIVQKLTDDSYYDVAARINDHGDYAYLIARDYFGNSDIAWHLGGKFTIHDSFNSPNAHPDINNSGQVVWDETFTSDASDQRVFFSTGSRSNRSRSTAYAITPRG